MKVNELQVGMVINYGYGQARVEAVAYDWAVVRDLDEIVCFRIWLVEPPEEFELHEEDKEEKSTYKRNPYVGSKP